MKRFFIVLALLLPIIFGVAAVDAQSQRTVTFKATINPGALLTDVRNQLGQSILEPLIDLGRVGSLAQCGSGDSALSGVLGSNEQRIYIDNPKAAYDGWTLTLAPVNGEDSSWASENGSKIDIDDEASDGCLDGDNDGNGGLMGIDPTDAEIYSDCLECNTGNIVVGSTTENTYSDYNSITLLRAGTDSDDLGSWYMTGVRVRQTVPAAQYADQYGIDMVLSVTAI